ncbi:MAG: imidazole glycerol phosphate synthase subunit HisH [Alphaproteobacteria bacterium]
MKIAIVDYGLGNLFSIRQACEHAGMGVHVTGDAAELASGDAVLLPGVGAFANAMQALQEHDLISPIQDMAAAGKPLIGVCLGLQLLMRESHEFGSHAGLGLIDGTVERLGDGDGALKVPHVGWNRIRRPDGVDWQGGVYDGLDDGAYMYFVHSYYVKPDDAAVVLSTTRFGEDEFCSSVLQGNIYACQFHPERSGSQGLRVYDNMARMLSQGRLS